MKRLTGIKLVNWHAFVDETIKIKNSVLLSGENGAGKSTILDAIQFILTCSKNNFNKAANENSKRNLAGYVRFKTGRENKEYEREGDITSHVALEFYEESKQNYFVIGAVIDSASESSEKILWYRIEKCKLSDIKFIINDEPVDISNFKAYGKDINLKTFNRVIDAKNDFSNRLGRLNDKFFELLPKASAFKPISNVKEFVYSYILDEKEVNIEDLRENIRTFKEFEELLHEVKVQINSLSDIKNKYSAYEATSRTIKSQEYLILMAEEEKLKNELEAKKKSLIKLNIRVESLQKDIEKIVDDIRAKTNISNKLKVDLNSNSEYRALEELKNNLDRIKNRYKEEKESKEKIIKLLYDQRKLISDLKNQELDRFYKMMTELDKNNLEEYKAYSIDIEKKITKINSEKQEYRARKSVELEKKEKERKELEIKIIELKKRNLQYSFDVRELKEGIIKETRKLGREIVPKILCELLEITEPNWKNAVEGYLNTQRFYFLVEKEDFDTVLKIYERLSKSQGLNSVGIINAKGLESYDTIAENSLAEVVISKSTDAKRYINMILGKVIKASDVSKLKDHKTSITTTCMMYKNNVARAINPKVYKTPYIGAEAYKEQLRLAEKNLNEVVIDINKLKEEVKETDSVIKIISNLKLDRIREKCDILKTVAETSSKIAELDADIKKLEKNNTYMDIQMRLNEIEDEIKLLNENKKENEDESINKMSEVKFTENIITDMEKKLFDKGQSLAQNKESIGALAKETEDKFTKEKEGKSIETIIINFNRNKEANQTKKEKQENEIKKLQNEYNNTYNLGAEIGINGMSMFLDKLDILERSKVIEYEEQVKTSRKNAEEEFKEHFLSKIQENISTARTEFKSLNKGLKGVLFGSEEYEFKIGKSKENKEYYDMIMDNENIGEGVTLFSNSYDNKYRELLNELFDKLTQDNQSNEAELIKLTDYRNYMSYDIEIKYKDDTTALFSKVSREKSGGETQTPFYVAMAASFLQLYKGINLSSDSIGLILFDEAFDKMDDARIMAMMEFYNKLDLQLIIAAPPQKIEPITPYVNTVLLAIKAGNFSIIEDMINEKL